VGEDTAEGRFAALKQRIKPRADTAIAAHALSTRANAPKHDDAGSIDPLNAE
jgi:hypothetical protein